MRPTQETINRIKDSLISNSDEWFLESEFHICHRMTNTNIFFKSWWVTIGKYKVILGCTLEDSNTIKKAIRVCLSNQML